MSLGKRLDYLKHNLYLGMNTGLGLTFSIKSDSYCNFADFPDKFESGNKYVSGYLSLPVVLDINLFNSSVFAVAKFVPQIYGYYKPEFYKETFSYNGLNLSVSELSFGFRGKVGDRFEFSLIPSLQSSIFVTGLEIKYLIPENKPQPQKELLKTESAATPEQKTDVPTVSVPQESIKAVDTEIVEEKK